MDQAAAQTILAHATCVAGEPKKGVEALAPVVQFTRALHLIPLQIPMMTALTDAYWRAGEYDKAKETAEELLEISTSCGAKFDLGVAHRLLGEVALSTNQPQAELHFEQSIPIFQGIKAENELALAYGGLGRCHKQQGDISEARECLTQALEIFERIGTLLEPDKVRKELAGLSVKGDGTTFPN
jgi:tetratricopeptide (TPR) repeat protein